MPALERQGDGFGTRLQVAAANFVGDRRVLWSVVGIMAVQRVFAGSIYSMENSSGVWSTVTLVLWHLPWLAQRLNYLTIAALLASTVWAAHSPRGLD